MTNMWDLTLVHPCQNLFQKQHPGGMGVGCADHSTARATHITLDLEEAGAEITIKYVYRKQEWK
jgi:hypothetical protein